MPYDAFTLKQTRYAQPTAEGGSNFRIDIECTNVRNTSAVTSLTPDVFVYSVDTSLQADVSSGGSIDGNFLRVATVADLDTLPVGLEDALATGASEFRSRSLQLSMPDLETATNAVPVIVDRVNSLISAYIEYQENFLQDTAFNYALPRSTDSSVVATYSNAYTNAVASRKEAEKAVEDKSREYELLQIRKELLSSYSSELEGYRDALSPLIDQVASLIVATSDGPTAISSISSLIPHKYTLLSLKNLLIALCSNRSNTLSQTIQSQENIVLSDLKDKENELVSLQRAESEALSDLATFCPQIDATSLS